MERSAREPEKKLTGDEIELNDDLLRLIGIPFFGIVIPNLAGLFGVLNYADVGYWLGYGYFILLAYLIWQGNRYLLFRTRKRFTWFDKPMEKLVLLFMNNIFYTAPLTVAWLCLWYAWAGFDKTDWGAIQMVVLINVICVLFVTHVYETVFLVKEKESETLRNEQLQRARAEAELVALKNQVDPHFMFNSLNTLTYLIKSDPEKALMFTENLAEVYRYILMQKDYTLIVLRDEIEFTNQYIALLQLRFGHSLVITQQFDDQVQDQYLIPPTSVFVAFENAVKHNEITEQAPLEIRMSLQGNMLTISNQKREKRSLQKFSRIGLRNLSERFRLATGRDIEILSDEYKFSVALPLVPLNDENTNHRR